MSSLRSVAFLGTLASLALALAGRRLGGGAVVALLRHGEPARRASCPSRRRTCAATCASSTDQQAGPEGAQWDAPVAITFDTGAGSLTYDLGRPTPVSAFVFQGDANDTYKIFGSLDGDARQLQGAGRGRERRGHGPRPAHARRDDHARRRCATCASPTRWATTSFRSPSSRPSACRRTRSRRTSRSSPRRPPRSSSPRSGASAGGTTTPARASRWSLAALGAGAGGVGRLARAKRTPRRASRSCATGC